MPKAEFASDRSWGALVKERPILFSAPMVRALLAGSKTQTRRALRHPTANSNVPGKHAPIAPYRNPHGGWNFVLAATGHGTGDPFPCPYGAPGDQLWVRETFIHEPADYCWEASVSIPSRPACTVYRADVQGDSAGAGWKPSIHMPRNLSRIRLEIADVRVERLQDISEADAIAEGLQRSGDGHAWNVEDEMHRASDPRDSYFSLWEAINGAGSVAANPWVWVVAFKRLGD